MRNKIAQEIFGVDYDSLGIFGKWEVEDKIKELNQNKDE
jgi:hypothetical protein